MSLSAPQLPPVAGAPYKVAIAAARYNARLVEALLGELRATLRAAGVRERNLIVVAGARARTSCRSPRSCSPRRHVRT